MLEEAMTSVVVYSETEARDLTERIRVATEDLASMLKSAHDGEVWRALGYKSWSAYIDSEFSFSRSRSYRLLDAARKQQRVSAAVGVAVRIPEGASRELDDNDLDELAADLREQLAQPNVRGASIGLAIQKVRSKHRQMPDKSGVFNGVSLAVDNVLGRMDGYEDEEIAGNLSHDERRAYERAVTKAAEFAERGSRILTMVPRTIEVSA